MKKDQLGHLTDPSPFKEPRLALPNKQWIELLFWIGAFSKTLQR